MTNLDQVVQQRLLLTWSRLSSVALEEFAVSLDEVTGYTDIEREKCKRQEVFTHLLFRVVCKKM